MQRSVTKKYSLLYFLRIPSEFDNDLSFKYYRFLQEGLAKANKIKLL